MCEAWQVLDSKPHLLKKKRPAMRISPNCTLSQNGYGARDNKNMYVSEQKKVVVVEQTEKLNFQEPPVGFEPTTSRLLSGCSTK